MVCSGTSTAPTVSTPAKDGEEVIHALSDDYNVFVSSLLLRDDLDQIAVQNTFIHEEDHQHRRCQEESPPIGSTKGPLSQDGHGGLKYVLLLKTRGRGIMLGQKR